MNYSFTIPPNGGEAFIAIKRNRTKQVNQNVYLTDGQEFEIELHNPSLTTKLAKISMNGKLISTTGIVIKPGQRLYLERYLDNTSKFKFETYKVDAQDNGALAAIQRNGDIEISFYNEEIPSEPIYRQTFSIDNSFGKGTGSTYYLNSQNLNGSLTNSSSLNSLSSYKDKPQKKGITRSGGAGGQSCSTDWMEQNSSLFEEEVQEKETGRIEQGSKSDQNFTRYHGKFSWFPTNTVKIKILPFSEKPLEVNDLVAYCPNCGSKNKSGKFNFCPKCGTKF